MTNGEYWRTERGVVAADGESHDLAGATRRRPAAAVVPRGPSGSGQGSSDPRQRCRHTHAHVACHQGGEPTLAPAVRLRRERFSAFELTDERGGEWLDRIVVIPGEIRIADRAYLQPDRIARVIEGASGNIKPCRLKLTRRGRASPPLELSSLS